MNATHHEEIRSSVRRNYAEMADSTDRGCGSPASSCCGDSVSTTVAETSLSLGYSAEDLAVAPPASNLGLGCGNPQLIAAIRPGETVLDLGSGAGFDCFLAARAVGPTGRVIGVDMTAEMVSKARSNLAASRFENVEFRLGEIEHLPVADGAVDLIISNCVINLSPDKEQVFNDAFRALRAGGRLAISDMLAHADIPPQIRHDAALYSGCAAGAVTAQEIEHSLRRIGFEQVQIGARAGDEDASDTLVYAALVQATKPSTPRSSSLRPLGARASKGHGAERVEAR